jgi:hypothetical protein
VNFEKGIDAWAFDYLAVYSACVRSQVLSPNGENIEIISRKMHLNLLIGGNCFKTLPILVAESTQTGSIQAIK